MQYLRSNPHDAGNPNIPRSCTTLLQSRPSAASGHTSVPHTHQPRPWVRGEKGFAEFLVGEKEGCCHFLVGEKAQHTHLTENTEGHHSELAMGSTATKKKRKEKKIKSSHTKQMGWVGENQKIDRHRKLSWKSERKCNLDFHFTGFEVSGVHLCIPRPPPQCGPNKLEIVLKWNILNNSHFMYLEIPIKRGSCLLVFVFFCFRPDWFSWWLCSIVNAKDLLLVV